METNMLLSVDNMTEHLRYIGKCGAMDINFYIENEIRAIKKISKADVDRAARQLLVEKIIWGLQQLVQMMLKNWWMP